MKSLIHSKILNNMDKICDWYSSQLQNVQVPFYSSYDIRDAGFKVTNVDANIFPAGFNNICLTDKEGAPELVVKYIRKHYPEIQKILLITEDHIKNSYYWENVFAIKAMVKEAGFELRLGMPGLEDHEQLELESYLGNKVMVEKVYNRDGYLQLDSYQPDLVISNNDFSRTYDNWSNIDQVKMTPVMGLGWHSRKKSTYFEEFNQVVGEFASLIGLDPWLLSVPTQSFEQFDLKDDDSREALAAQVDALINETKVKYSEYKIDKDPFVFIKNDSGTYGLGITVVSEGQQVLEWTYKERKKMKAQKGGGQFSRVILQEGVPTDVASEGQTAEPTIYMLGDELAGGFLRVHKDKTPYQSLNSPGAVYKRLCLSDLKVKAEGCMMENVYGWSSKLGLLAIGRETQKMDLLYKGYING